MAPAWYPVVIANELYETACAYFEEHKEELKLRDGIRSKTSFINYCIREYLKKLGAI